MIGAAAGHLGAVLMLAYLVTFFVAFPLWIVLIQRWNISYLIASLIGTVLGGLTGFMFYMLNEHFIFSFLLWSGGLGGLLAAITFRRIVGRR